MKGINGVSPAHLRSASWMAGAVCFFIFVVLPALMLWDKYHNTNVVQVTLEAAPQIQTTIPARVETVDLPYGESFVSIEELGGRRYVTTPRKEGEVPKKYTFWVDETAPGDHDRSFKATLVIHEH